MLRVIFSLTVVVGLAGCTSNPPVLVTEAQGVEPVSAIRMGCRKPWPLTQNCTSLSGPTKLVEINEVRFKVAGTAEETTTVMFGGTRLGNQGSTSNVGFEMMKRELVTRGHEIVSVVPIISSGTVFGYAIETKEPTYQIWQEFAVE